MPSLNDSRKTIETTIPGIQGSKVVLWDSLTMGDVEAIEVAQGNMARAVETLHRLLKEWNLDEPINVENIKKLEVKTINHLMGQTSCYKDAMLKADEKESEAIEKKTA